MSSTNSLAMKISCLLIQTACLTADHAFHDMRTCVPPTHDAHADNDKPLEKESEVMLAVSK